MSKATPPTESKFGYTTENPVIEVIRHETKIDPKVLSDTILAMDKEAKNSWGKDIKKKQTTPNNERERK
jgi:hypothetical protein